MEELEEEKEEEGEEVEVEEKVEGVKLEVEEEVKLVEVAGRELEYGVEEGIGDGVDISLNKGAGG